MPSLIQALGTRAGVGFGTAMQKLLAGANVGQGSAEYLRRLGFVDQAKIDSGEIQLDKHGKINTQSLKGKSWLKDTEAINENFVTAMVHNLLPRAGAAHAIRGLNSAAIAKAWDEGRTEDLAQWVKGMNRLDVMQFSVAMANGNQRMAALIDDIVLKLPSLLRERMNRKAVQGGMGADGPATLTDYDTAKSAVGSAANRLWLNLLGGDGMDRASALLNGFAGAINGLADAAHKFPKQTNIVFWVGSLGVALLSFGATLGAVTKMVNLAKLGLGLGTGVAAAESAAVAGAAARASLAKKLIGGVGVVGTGYMVGQAVYDNWDDIKAAMPGGANRLNAPSYLSPSWLPDWLAGAKNSGRSNFADYASLPSEEMYREAMRASGRSGPSMIPSDQYNFANQAAQRVEVSVTAPQSIEVKVTGTLSGSVNGVTGNVNGSGSVPLGATADRGQALTGARGHM